MWWQKKKIQQTAEIPKLDPDKLVAALAGACMRICETVEEIRTEMAFQNSMLALRTIFLDSQGFQLEGESGQQRSNRKIQNLARLIATAQSYLDFKLQQSANNMMQGRQLVLDGLKALKKNFLLGAFENMLAYLEPRKSGETVADKNFEAHLSDDIVLLKKRAEESPAKIEAPDEFYPGVAAPFAKEVENVIGRFFQIEELPEGLVEEISALRIGLLNVLQPAATDKK